MEGVLITVENMWIEEICGSMRNIAWGED